MRRLKNNSGMTLIELIVAIAMMAFFAVFMPKVFQQTSLMYRQATMKTDMDRMQQLMLSTARNTQRMKDALAETLGPAKYTKLINCFGQKAPDQATKPNVVDCKSTFIALDNSWQDLKDSTSPINNKYWGLNGECQDADGCMFHSWAKYYISCVPTRCFSIHLMMGLTPTDDMIKLKDGGGDTKGFSYEDFEEKRMQVTFPPTMFGLSGEIKPEKCMKNSRFRVQLDFNYNMLYCTDLDDDTSCKVSIKSINNAQDACAKSGFSDSDPRTIGSFDPVKIDLNTSATKKAVTITAFPIGTGGTVKQPDPKDPEHSITVNLPYFNKDKGDLVKIICQKPIGSRTFSEPPFSFPVELDLSDFHAGDKIDCEFKVITNGVPKGIVGHTTLPFINTTPVLGGGGGGNTGTTNPGSTGTGAPPEDIPSIDL